MMMWDLNMYHETLDVEDEKVEMPMLARSTDLNEELGLVSHVFRYARTRDAVCVEKSRNDAKQSTYPLPPHTHPNTHTQVTRRAP